MNTTGNDQHIRLYPIAGPGEDEAFGNQEWFERLVVSAESGCYGEDFKGAVKIQHFCIVVDIDSDIHVPSNPVG